jgi:hypothetical protein
MARYSRKLHKPAPNPHAKLGTGGRFAALRKKGISGALAAYIGRKKYGAKRFNKLAAKGR